MSKKVLVEGRPVIVPDDATPDEIDQIAGGGNGSAPAKANASYNIQPQPESGFSHPINWLTNAMEDIRQGGDSTVIGKAYRALGGQPIQSGAGGGNPAAPVNQSPAGPPQLLGGPAVGPLQALRGGAKILSGHPITGANDVVSGIAQTAAPFAGAASPVVIPAALGAGAVQTGVSKTASALGAGPDTSEFAGNMAALLAASGGAKFSKMMAARDLPIGKEQVVQGIKAAVNPPIGDVRGFTGNLHNQLDTVLSHAKENNMDVSTRAGFSEALQSAAKADPYRSTFIDPYKDVTTDIGPSYHGGTTLNGTHATVGQLDARLAAINDQLYPRYMKGGAGSSAAQAAINSGDAAQLGSEANMIRQKLAETVSKQSNVPAEQVRGARANYEQMKSLSEDFEDALNKENFDHNAQAGQPLTFGGAVTAAKNIPLNPANWGTNPAGIVRDRLFNGAMRNYQPQSPLKFDIGQPKPVNNVNPVRTPLSQQVNTSGMDMTTFQPNSPNAGQAVQQNLSVRRAANQLDQVRAQNSITSQHEALISQQAARDAVRKQRIADLLKNNPATEIGYNTGQ